MIYYMVYHTTKLTCYNVDTTLRGKQHNKIPTVETSRPLVIDLKKIENKAVLYSFSPPLK